MVNLSFVPGKSGPFRLKSMGNGIYQIHVAKGPAFEGPKLKIFKKALEFGIFRQDLRVAVSEMHKMGHNVAEFGISGRFMFTRLESKRHAA